jgi:hypothetical protein
VDRLKKTRKHNNLKLGRDFANPTTAPRRPKENIQQTTSGAKKI